MIRKTLAAAMLFTLAACTPAQLDRAGGYQAQIAGACRVAMTIAPLAGPYAVWIIGACSTEDAIAKLALDPSSHEWILDLIAKARSR